MTSSKLILAFLISSICSLSWSIDFDANTTLKSSRLTIKLNTAVNNRINDLTFGAFVERGDTLFCVADIYAASSNTTEVSTFIFWKDNFFNEGFIPGEDLLFYARDEAGECIIALVPHYFNVQPVGILSPSEEIIVDSFELTYGSFTYANTSTCRNAPLIITPEINNIPDFFEVNYSGASNVVNESTGELNLNVPDTGVYPITAFLKNQAENYCWETNPIDIHLWDAYPIANDEIDYSITHQHCKELGAISVSEELYNQGYQSFFVDEESSFISPMGASITTAFGSHTLAVIDSNDCKLVLAEEVDVLNAGNCNDAYYLSAENGQPSFIEFDYGGEIIIRDRSGQVIKNLQGPTSWNGVDEFGEHIGFGLYYIQFENGDVAQLRSYQ